MPAPVVTSLDFGNARRIQNLPAANANGQPIIFEQFNAAVEGQAWKDSVRVRAPSNVNLTSPGTTIDAITMAINDRFLAPNQTTGTENGLYIYNGSATPATRALDANTGDELESAFVPVEEGTSAGTVWRQTQVNFVIGTGTPTFVSAFNSAGPASEGSAGIAQIATQSETDTGTNDAKFVTPLKLANLASRFRKVSQTIGDGSATLYTVTHNLNTRVVNVQVWETSGNFRQALVETRATTVNSVDIVFDTAPASGAYLVVVES